MTGPTRLVTSSREHLGGIGKTRQGPDEREKRCVVPAMEDHEGGGAPVKSEWGEAGNVAYPKLGCSNGVVDEVCEVVAELWVWCSGL
jgi:hypothetical protein